MKNFRISKTDAIHQKAWLVYFLVVFVGREVHEKVQTQCVKRTFFRLALTAFFGAIVSGAMRGSFHLKMYNKSFKNTMKNDSHLPR